MRPVAMILWLLLPLVAVAYHLGPGQERVRQDGAAEALARASAHVGAEEWTEAVAAYDAALSLLPTDAVDAQRRTRLLRARATMQQGGLPDAHADLSGLLAEVQADPTADPGLVRDTRAALAGAQYYMT